MGPRVNLSPRATLRDRSCVRDKADCSRKSLWLAGFGVQIGGTCLGFTCILSARLLQIHVFTNLDCLVSLVQ